MSRPSRLKKRLPGMHVFGVSTPVHNVNQIIKKTVLKYTDIDNEFKKIINFKNNNNSAL